MGTLTWLSREGDETLEWDPADEKDVSKARQKFEDLKKKGYLAYTQVTKTVKEKGEVIQDFNPDLGAIIMRPQMSGG